MWGLNNNNNMWGMSAGQYQNQDFNNNNMWGLPTGIGGQPSYSNNQYQKNENLPGLDGVNTAHWSDEVHDGRPGELPAECRPGPQDPSPGDRRHHKAAQPGNQRRRDGSARQRKTAE